MGAYDLGAFTPAIDIVEETSIWFPLRGGKKIYEMQRWVSVLV